MRLVAVALVALVLAGCAEPSPPGPESPDAPAWSFTATDGTVYSRDTPPGNATVLFFMATWCGSCRTKAPVIADVAADHTADGVRVYSIDFDPSETVDDLESWKDRYQQAWPHGVDPDRAVQRALGVTSQSSVVVLDGEGRVVERFGYGKVTDAGLRDALSRALSA